MAFVPQSREKLFPLGSDSVNEILLCVKSLWKYLPTSLFYLRDCYFKSQSCTSFYFWELFLLHFVNKTTHLPHFTQSKISLTESLPCRRGWLPIFRVYIASCQEASHKLHKSLFVKDCKLPQGTASELTRHVCGRCWILCENLTISVNGNVGCGPKAGDDASLWRITIPTQHCMWSISLAWLNIIITCALPLSWDGKSHQKAGGAESAVESVFGGAASTWSGWQQHCLDNYSVSSYS